MNIFVMISLIVAAFVTATISGFLGMGGGIILLGVMSILLVPSVVVPIHGVVQLSSNTTRTVLFLKHVRWSVFLIYVGPATLGCIGASLVWSGDKLDWFKPMIGAFIIAYLVYRRYKPTVRNVPIWVYAPLGLCTGFLAIFVGATGPFLAPFMLRDDFTKENIIATKSVCQFLVHLTKIPVFLSLGFDYEAHWVTLSLLVLAVIGGTFLGKGFLEKSVRHSSWRYSSWFWWPSHST